MQKTRLFPNHLKGQSDKIIDSGIASKEEINIILSTNDFAIIEKWFSLRKKIFDNNDGGLFCKNLTKQYEMV